MIAAAPDIEPRFEKLYGYLRNDIKRRRAGVGLALEFELTGCGFGNAYARSRLGERSPLVRTSLLRLDESGRSG